MGKPVAKDLAGFRAAHDRDVIVPNKIRTALAAMLAEGPENWEYESDFIRRAGISQSDMGQYRDQFMAHVVKTSQMNKKSARTVWFADAKVARRVRGDA